MQRVFVLDEQKRPLMPCRPARARWLLTQQRAAVFRSAPFTIILHEARPEAVVTPLRLKIDPGSAPPAWLSCTRGVGRWCGRGS